MKTADPSRSFPVSDPVAGARLHRLDRTHRTAGFYSLLDHRLDARGYQPRTRGPLDRPAVRKPGTP